MRMFQVQTIAGLVNDTEVKLPTDKEVEEFKVWLNNFDSELTYEMRLVSTAG